MTNNFYLTHLKIFIYVHLNSYPETKWIIPVPHRFCLLCFCSDKLIRRDGLEPRSVRRCHKSCSSSPASLHTLWRCLAWHDEISGHMRCSSSCLWSLSSDMRCSSGQRFPPPKSECPGGRAPMCTSRHRSKVPHWLGWHFSGSERRPWCWLVTGSDPQDMWRPLLLQVQSE